jgi:2-oxoglutarate ferredoxin oxidoreductase subunit delta
MRTAVTGESDRRRCRSADGEVGERPIGMWRFDGEHGVRLSENEWPTRVYSWAWLRDGTRSTTRRSARLACLMTDRPNTGQARRRAVARPRSSRQAARVVIDVDLCKSCDICRRLCPQDVFDRDRKGRPVPARLEDCTACRLCEQHCPDFAIEVFQSGGTQEATEGEAAGNAAGPAAAQRGRA